MAVKVIYDNIMVLVNNGESVLLNTSKKTLSSDILIQVDETSTTHTDTAYLSTDGTDGEINKRSLLPDQDR